MKLRLKPASPCSPHLHWEGGFLFIPLMFLSRNWFEALDGWFWDGYTLGLLENGIPELVCARQLLCPVFGMGLVSFKHSI